MIATKMACPDRHQISELVHGRIQDEGFEQVCEHVVNCKPCSEVARQIESGFADPTSHFSIQGTRALAGNDTGVSTEATAKNQTGRFGEYEVVREIGEGGMGVVYLVKLSRPKRLFAAKALRAKLANDDEFRVRFEREIRNVVELEAHPNIVRITHWSLEPSPYYVMDYCDGKNLKEVIDSRPVSIGNAVEIIRQAASAIAHAHAGGVIHRDIKPANILVERKGNIRVADFGLSKSKNDEISNLSNMVVFLGTPDYCSPEQANFEQAGPASDVYSLGCTFFELLTGKPPYSERDDSNDKLNAHRTQPLPELVGVPQSISRLLAKMTNKSATARPTASEVQATLSALNEPHNLSELLQPTGKSAVVDATQTPAVRVRPQGRRQRSSRWSRWSRNWVLTATALLLAAVVGGWMLYDTVISKKFAEGTLVATIPDGSEYQVLIDGDKVDETVWKFESRDGKDQISIRMKPGEHKFELIRNGLTTYTDSFSIDKGKATELNVEFTPLEPAKELEKWLAELGGTAKDGDIYLRDLDLRNIGSFEKLSLSKKLQHLDLRGSQLPTAGLPDLPARLMTLKLGETQDLNENHFRDIGKIRLQSLQINKAQIKGGFAFLKQTKGLDQLFLQGSEFPPEEIANIAQLVGLKDLSLEVYPHGSEEDLLCLESLTNLNTLNLNSTNAGDEVLKNVIGKLENLQKLDFARNEASPEGLKGLAENTRLKKICLNYCRGVTGEGLSNLAQNKDLESLRIYGTGIAPDDFQFLSDLPSIQRLELGDFTINAASLECFKAMPKLRWLGLDTVKLSGLKQKDVIAALPNCEISF